MSFEAVGEVEEELKPGGVEEGQAAHVAGDRGGGVRQGRPDRGEGGVRVDVQLAGRGQVLGRTVGSNRDVEVTRHAVRPRRHAALDAPAGRMTARFDRRPVLILAASGSLRGMT
ncbi:hypothetical protein [Streptomyces erythrochromogenes]|uniref:hypothetical protein n=1 Tax=Streptomyces erythrochromogenes TaxID=285574 RepID=UPI00369C933D